ncbi:uncharacterized protein LOC121609883 [Chelmon rostratus]|uniref:uncharacterized protein LOC121609883 n=1 Tax=Chelmon rostratus TaxID=109905 RepID=UPI001BE70C1D|nr:uncharacterized protein LOC121609883 [Chelmon rostratus]
MSVTRTEVDGVTVFTVTSDPRSPCPPLCQMLKGLCYSPVCCSVSQHLRRVQETSQFSLLGALHIVVGLLTIGLGCILCSSGGATWVGMEHTLFPFWFGGMFMLLGVISILSEKWPSPCLVFLNLVLNLLGVAVVITAIVLYCISMANIHLWWMCHEQEYPEYTTPAPSSKEKMMMERCLQGEALTLMLMRGMNALLIILSVLELCVIISCVVLGIKALGSSEKREYRSTGDPETCRAVMEEFPTNPTA